MTRAYSPKEIARKSYKTLAWGGRWEQAFGQPEENSTWFITGPSASGKSSFVMQMAEELTHHGRVLYMSYEEGVSLSFQQRLLLFGLDRRQGWIRVCTKGSVKDLEARLKRRGSPKFIIVDSFQEAGWGWPETEALIDAFPKKSFIFISQEDKGKPIGKPAVRLRYKAGVKVRVAGFRAWCQGRFSSEAGNYYTVWEEGLMRTTNNIPK